jgi:hypothetical protein
MAPGGVNVDPLELGPMIAPAKVFAEIGSTVEKQVAPCHLRRKRRNIFHIAHHDGQIRMGSQQLLRLRRRTGQCFNRMPTVQQLFHQITAQ